MQLLYFNSFDLQKNANTKIQIQIPIQKLYWYDDEL